MTTYELQKFIDLKMSTNHIYQPAIVLSLLSGNGEASVGDIAKLCAEVSGKPACDFEKKLLKYPREALIKHGVITESARRFKLAVELSESTAEQREAMIQACRCKLSK